MVQCKVKGCSGIADTRGLCVGHYCRLKKHGDVHRGGPIRVRKSSKYTNFQWLKDNADHTGEDCLLWPFGKFANGYGQVCIAKSNKVASREMCILAHGSPPTVDHEAAHSCGNGHLGCVNPRHLRWATKIENEGDKSLHRVLRGSAAARLCA